MMSRTVFRARISTALLFMVIGLVAIWQSLDLKFGSLKMIGPGFFPVVFGSLLTGLSILMLAGVLLARRRSSESAETAEEDEPTRLRGTLAFVGVFVLFLVVSYLIGFMAGIFVSTAAAALLLGMKGWRLATLTILTTVAVWLIFDLWLGISLPPGIWL